MFVVYWMENRDAAPAPACKLFGKMEMGDALAFMEALRGLQRSGEREVAFITMASENPDAVGLAGAADPASSYAWTKRRGNTPRAKRDLKPGDYEDH